MSETGGIPSKVTLPSTSSVPLEVNGEKIIIKIVVKEGHKGRHKIKDVYIPPKTPPQVTPQPSAPTPTTIPPQKVNPPATDKDGKNSEPADKNNSTAPVQQSSPILPKTSQSSVPDIKPAQQPSVKDIQGPILYDSAPTKRTLASFSQLFDISRPTFNEAVEKWFNYNPQDVESYKTFGDCEKILTVDVSRLSRYQCDVIREWIHRYCELKEELAGHQKDGSFLPDSAKKVK